MNNKNNKQENKVYMFTKSEIIARGWTESMIKKLLPEPAMTKPNPHNKTYPMKLWPEDLVEAIEKTDDFLNARKKAEIRRAAGIQAGIKGVVTKTKKLTEELKLEAERIHVTILNDDDLRKRVFEDRLIHESARDEYELRHHCSVLRAYSSPECASEETIQRWIVNYIRHNLTTYDEILFWYKSRTGMSSCYCDFKNAVLMKIAEAYPKYADECRQQML